MRDDDQRGPSQHIWELDEGLNSLEKVLEGARQGIVQTLKATDGVFSVSFTPNSGLNARVEPPRLTPEEYEAAFGRPQPDGKSTS